MAIGETLVDTSTTAAIAAPIITFIEPMLVVAALVFVDVVNRSRESEVGGVTIGVLEITGWREHSTVSACRRKHYSVLHLNYKPWLGH